MYKNDGYAFFIVYTYLRGHVATCLTRTVESRFFESRLFKVRFVPSRCQQYFDAS